MGMRSRVVAAALLLLFPSIAHADSAPGCEGPRLFRSLLARCSLGHRTTTTTAHYGDPSLYPVGTYGWPGDYYDPRFPEPIALKTEKAEKTKKTKPAPASEILPRPRPVNGQSPAVWLHPPR